ncbi:hypothetical protein MHTCC0001_29620 [Flavobacteriaceae bacterium MHTCC 0001]
MKISFGLKIGLLISTILHEVFFMFVVFLVGQKKEFEWSMLILFGLALAGLFSVIYHFKTLHFYNKKQQFSWFSIRPFWIFNLIFSIVVFVLSLYLMYTYYSIYSSFKNQMLTGVLVSLIVTIFMLIFSILSTIECSELYKKMVNVIKQDEFESIDDIKGCQDDDLD